MSLHKQPEASVYSYIVPESAQAIPYLKAAVEFEMRLNPSSDETYSSLLELSCALISSDYAREAELILHSFPTDTTVNI